MDQESATRLARLRRVAWMLDAAVRLPGTRVRFGLNSLLGLAPWAGDATLAAVSLYIVWEARRLGVPPATLRRMLLNVGIEAALGAAPVLGDVLDIAFKANLRNLRLIERHMAGLR